MDELIYLDNASTTFPKPPEVLEFMMRFYSTRGVNPGRTGIGLALEAGETITQARRELMELFGGTDYNRVVFGLNVTDALNLLINSVLDQGGHAVTTRLEHNSVLRPLYYLKKYKGVEVDYVGFDADGYVDPGEIKDRLRDDTKLVVINHGSNVLGTIQPVDEIGAICREKGVVFAIDSAQTAGVVPIDACEMNIDVVCFTGHKSLLGPTGIGGMYVCESLELKPCRSGGSGLDSSSREQPEPYPWRMEFGTLNTVGIAGLLAGQKWIAEQGGVEKLHQREMELTSQLVEGLSKIDGVTLYCAKIENKHLPVVSLNIEGLSAPEVGDILAKEHNIACRAGLHCAPLVHEELGTAQSHDGSVRISVGPFNTKEHIQKALDAIAGIAEDARKKGK